jgi:deoxyribodipyrimidine photo-lyase
MTSTIPADGGPPLPAATPDSPFAAGRAGALAQLAVFLPNAGSHYANERNADLGADRRDNVSRLSPALRHRLIDEDEVVRAVLARHTYSSAEKFIQEVCWRTYWKGWLELRPGVWTMYRASLDEQFGALGERDGGTIDRSLRRRWQAAIDGNTGIGCFDHWVQELRDSGYLHNHARMWFASIWIFTLNLPWQLGADFFLRHLLDGDPASNTLSWRWVAGLQTRGKHYLARADNIQKHSGNRWWPKGELNESAGPLPPDELPAAGILPLADAPTPGLRTALWLHEDDLGAERWNLPAGLALVAIGGDVVPEARSWLPVADRVIDWTDRALADGVARAGARHGVPAQRVRPAERHRWLADHGIEQVLTMAATVGPVAEAQAALDRELAASGIRLVRLRRAWDNAFWPHAAKGYFQLRERIRPTLAAIGIP